MYTCLHLYRVFITYKIDKTSLNPDFTITQRFQCIYVNVTGLCICKQGVYWKEIFFWTVGVFILISHLILSAPLWHVIMTLKKWTAKWSVRSITPADTVSAGNCPVGAPISATLSSALCSLCVSTLVADHNNLVR